MVFSEQSKPGTDISVGLASELFHQAFLTTDRSVIIAEAGVDESPIVFVNPAFEHLTGYLVAEVLGRDASFLQGSQTDGAAVKQMSEAIAALKPVTITLINYRKDGSSFWNEMSITPIYGVDGSANHFVAVLSDVTTKVLAQRDLESVYSSERIAHTVARSANLRFEAILEQMPAGVLVAAAPSGRLLRGNSEMERIFGHPFVAVETVDGYGAYVAFHENGERYKPHDWPLARAIHGETTIDEEIVIRRGDGSSGIILMRASPVLDEDSNIVAAIAVFEDITERKRGERQLARERERSWALAATLQKSLLPPELPEIKGFDFGAAYTPVAEGLDVGGDFYDLFNQRDGTMVIVIGDVMGKGAEAAAITSLARHALRTAGLRSRRPSTLLGILNQALMREAENVEDRPFCTVAAAVLSPEEHGINLSLALGGHPRPFVMRENGDVHQIGEPGTLVGILESVEMHDVDVTLQSGDTVVMYTDGVTEAHQDGQLLGEDGVAEILRKLHSTSASATDIADGLEREVLAYARGVLKDDLAILVVKVTGEAVEPMAHL